MTIKELNIISLAIANYTLDNGGGEEEMIKYINQNLETIRNETYYIIRKLIDLKYSKDSRTIKVDCYGELYLGDSNNE
jgi:hypothetical protein